MDLLSVALLIAAGLGSGLAGSIGGLASLVSYPALLAFGLPPVVANVTNTVAMFSTTVGTAAGSRQELRGHGRRVAKLVAVAAVGGTAGAWLLLATPAKAFEFAAPLLIAFGSALLLARDPLRRLADARAAKPTSFLPLAVAVALVGVYGGYFGAASGVIMLAVLCAGVTEPLPVTNAVKNMATGAANITAAVAYAFLAPVHWLAAGALSCGCLVGSWLGPKVVRRLPERPLRFAIALAGFGLAVSLWMA
ncbi:sulfite exporter TauE/SafE family protein [Nonomuraea polychroma]|uniref:sulfite exporter TauE/SafE family protein n=1 Tax=Nonomuraea polychroma TaxID=46176 RepID=UPI003D936544